MPKETANGWSFSPEERADMAKAFKQLYAETEKLLGSHMHNFKTLKQSGILDYVPNQMQMAVK